jgi:acetoin utilization deacetylase AcuC-like enzyme
MTTGYLYSPVFLEHKEEEHPEAPERLEEILRVLQNTGILARLVAIEPQSATDAQIFAVHAPEHLARIERVISHARGTAHLDPDTYVNAHSLIAARLAAGAVVRAVDAVMHREVDNAFALVRPPGHHATRGDSMGFCILNNIAVGAQHALDAHHLERVLIVDYDVHHGNGTQDIFYRDPRVMFFSSHLYPFYPGTGNWNEIGSAEGMSYTINVPLPAGVGDRGYQQVFDDLLFPLAERYRPQLMMVSAGFDAHWRDPLAMANMSIAGYTSLTRTLMELARELCGGRLVVALEGGYDLDVLSQGVAAVFRVLLGDPDIRDAIGSSTEPEADISDLVERLKGIHRLV